MPDVMAHVVAQRSMLKDGSTSVPFVGLWVDYSFGPSGVVGLWRVFAFRLVSMPSEANALGQRCFSSHSPTLYLLAIEDCVVKSFLVDTCL